MLLSLVAMPAIVVAQAHPEHRHERVVPAGDAQIIVIINPEARVSAAIGAPLPPPVKCGEAAELKIKVVNQGVVTAPLMATLVGDGSKHVDLHMEKSKLTGAPEEGRALHLIPTGPDAADVTIAFSLDRNIGDLGGRDRVHLLVRCLSAPSLRIGQIPAPGLFSDQPRDLLRL